MLHVVRHTLPQWLASLPLFEASPVPPRVTPLGGYYGPDETAYIIELGDGKLVLKHYADGPEKPLPGKRAKDKAAAEAIALPMYAPGGEAPELIWEGPVEAQPGTYATISKWVEGTPADERPLTGQEIEQLAGALRTIHGNKEQVRLIAHTPRDLEAWWAASHETYRDMPQSLTDSLPAAVRESLTKVVQSVAADAQAHKRFWHLAPLTQIYGSPLPGSAVWKDGKPVLVSWERFGMGDPAYEVAYTASEIARTAGPEAGEALVTGYLAGVDDPSLATRITMYRRLLPFSMTVDLMAQAGGPFPYISDKAGALAHYLEAALVTYEWSGGNTPEVAAQAREWAKSRTVAGEDQG